MERLTSGDKITYETKNSKGELIRKKAIVQRAFYNSDCEFVEDNTGFSLEAWCNETGNMLLLHKSYNITKEQ